MPEELVPTAEETVVETEAVEEAAPAEPVQADPAEQPVDINTFAAEPSKPEVSADEDVADEIARYNAALEEEESADDAEPLAIEEEEAEEIADETETVAEAVEIPEFSADDPPEVYEEKKKAVFDAFEEVPAEIKALVDFQEARIAALSETVATDPLGDAPNKELVLELSSAVNQLYDAEIDPQTGEIAVNAKPLVELFQTKLTNEFNEIATEMFSTDSRKYEGATKFEELLIDTFGAEKASKMVAFGRTDVPLPVIPQIALPQGIDETLKEAYFQLPQSKKFQVEGLVEDIGELEREVREEEPSEWRKEEIATALKEKRELLNAEIESISDRQQRIEFTRQQQTEATQRQQQAAERFRNTVNTEYTKQIFDLAEKFAADLAPRLTYADGDTQLSQARNVMARINNALSEGPMAEHAAKQLRDEGIKFDFVKGRELLDRHYKAVENLEGLKLRNASPQAIEVAKKKVDGVMFDITREQKSLLGQLSAKYVTSSGAALTKQVEAVKAKKQINRIATNGQSVSQTKERPVEEEIAEWNRRIAASNPDELFNAHAN